MPRFFTARENIGGTSLIIDSDDVNHISRVLRLGEGDEITVCDGQGYDYSVRIAKIGGSMIECDILEKVKSDTEPNVEVVLFQGLPKSSKMDYIIQKTTELGISKIVPCALSRCVVKLENEKAERKKTERWQKVAEAAAKQSGRGIIPEISMPVSLDTAIEELKECDICFVPYECETKNSLKSVLTSAAEAKKVGFIIGPEGGFDPVEIEKISEAKIPLITLGKRILRTETAGEAVLAMVMYEIGDINNA